MQPHELMSELKKKGIKLYLKNDQIFAKPKTLLTPELQNALVKNRHSFRRLLLPQRCEATPPLHWQNHKDLPPKGQKLERFDKSGKRIHYKINLFDQWYMLWYEENIDSVGVIDTQRKRRMFANLDEFYRWAWAEYFFKELTLDST